MVKAASTVVVEIDGPKNEGLHFRPLGRTVRGRFDPRRMNDPQDLIRRYPDGIPGQRIGLNLDTGEGFIEEPLHDSEFKAVREKIQARFTLPPEREIFQGVDVDTWSYWLQGAVTCGLARIVHGAVPAFDESKVQVSFVTQAAADPIDKLAAAIDKQTDLLTKLLSQR